MVGVLQFPLPLVGRDGAEGARVGINAGIWVTIMPHSAIAKETRSRSRSLRRTPTDAERKLWQILRGLKPFGMHFRRQAPIGPYVVDFAWYAKKLVVEVDGGQHADARRAHDEQRTMWLNSQGYRVMRFWNNDVLTTPRDVGEAIVAAAANGPTPDPSPQGGGERAGAR